MKFKFSRKLLSKAYGGYDNDRDFIEDLLATISPEEESQKIMMEQVPTPSPLEEIDLEWPDEINKIVLAEKINLIIKQLKTK